MKVKFTKEKTDIFGNPSGVITNPNELINKALEHVNHKYADNISFNNCKTNANYATVTLRVKDSRGVGSRKSISGKRTVAACWHVWGDYLDKIFALDSGACVWVGGNKFTADTWEWREINIGSRLFPKLMSQLCNCGENDDALNPWEIPSPHSLFNA